MRAVTYPRPGFGAGRFGCTVAGKGGCAGTPDARRSNEAAMQREILADGTVLQMGADGCTVLQRLASGVILFTAVGAFETTALDSPMKEFDRELEAAGSLTLFLNLTERRGVAHSSRQVWSDWGRRHRDRIRAHVLVRSKLVDMALSVMAMLAGGVRLKSYSDVRAFEAAIAQEVPGFRRLPDLPAKARTAAAARP